MIPNHSIGRCLQAIAQHEVDRPSEQFLRLSRHFEKVACLYCGRILESGEQVYIAECSLSSLRTRSEDSQVPQPMLPAKRLQFGTDIVEKLCSGIRVHKDIVYLRVAAAQATISPARGSASAAIRPEHLFLAGASRLKINPCLFDRCAQLFELSVWSPRRPIFVSLRFEDSAASICLRPCGLGCLATLGCGLSSPP